jgi:hypothetical protein
MMVSVMQEEPTVLDRSDFEAGDEPLEVQGPPEGPGLVLSIRFSNQDARRLFWVAERAGLNSVEFARRVVLRELERHRETDDRTRG